MCWISLAISVRIAVAVMHSIKEHEDGVAVNVGSGGP